MNYKVIVRARAEEDILQAYRWYEEQRKGIGDDFLLCIEAAIHTIQDNPFGCPQIYKEVRRFVIQRFPHAVFYTLSHETISVIAVSHHRRSPGIWKRRA